MLDEAAEFGSVKCPMPGDEFSPSAGPTRGECVTEGKAVDPSTDLRELTEEATNEGDSDVLEFEGISIGEATVESPVVVKFWNLTDVMEV